MTWNQSVATPELASDAAENLLRNPAERPRYNISYIHYVKGLRKYYGMSPERLGLYEVRNYQLSDRRAEVFAAKHQLRCTPDELNRFAVAGAGEADRWSGRKVCPGQRSTGIKLK